MLALFGRIAQNAALFANVHCLSAVFESLQPLKTANWKAALKGTSYLKFCPTKDEDIDNNNVDLAIQPTPFQLFTESCWNDSNINLSKIVF